MPGQAIGSSGAQYTISRRVSVEGAGGSRPPAVAVTLNSYIPTCVGVPEMTPVPAFKPRPGGRAPLSVFFQVQVTAAGVLWRVWVYVEPTRPSGTALLLMQTWPPEHAMEVSWRRRTRVCGGSS